MSRDKEVRDANKSTPDGSERSTRKRPDVRSRSEDGADGSVGYGRPPRAHQFKPGQSGNPKGRPKGRKNEATMLDELLFQKTIAILERGRERRIPVFEAILRRFAEASLKGNIKAALFLLGRLGAVLSPNSQQAGLSDDDEAVLKAFAQDVLSKNTKEEA